MLLCVLSCWDPGFLGTSLKNGFSSQCPMFENASFPCINVKLVTSTNLNMTSCYLCTCRMYLLSYTSILASNRRQVTETKTAGSSHLSICATFEICQLQTSPANNGNPLQRFDHGGSKKRWWGGRCSSPPFKHGIAEAPVVQTAQFGPQGMHIRPKSPTQCGLARLERWGEEKFITWKPLQCSCAMGIGTHGAAIFTSSCGCEILPVLAFSTSDANGL